MPRRCPAQHGPDALEGRRAARAVGLPEYLSGNLSEESSAERLSFTHWYIVYARSKQRRIP